MVRSSSSKSVYFYPLRFFIDVRKAFTENICVCSGAYVYQLISLLVFIQLIIINDLVRSFVFHFLQSLHFAFLSYMILILLTFLFYDKVKLDLCVKIRKRYDNF